MKTSSAKAKGRSFQQAIRDILTAAFNWEEGDAESRSMGSAGVDLLFSPRARRDFPVSVECKKTRAHPARAEVSQAKANARSNELAIVVWAGHRQGPDKAMMICDFAEFLQWYKGIKDELPGDIYD